MPYKDPKKAQAAQNERKHRQSKIATLWYQGNTKADIVKKTGYSSTEVERHLRLIKRSLLPKTARVLQYRTNKVLTKINLVQQLAWEIAGKGKKTKGGYPIALSALRVITSSQELEAKVEGVTQEKLVVGPEKEASRLLSEVLNLEKKAKVAQGSETSAQGEVNEEKETPLPSFLKDIEDAELGNDKLNTEKD